MTNISPAAELSETSAEILYNSDTGDRPSFFGYRVCQESDPEFRYRSYIDSGIQNLVLLSFNYFLLQLFLFPVLLPSEISCCE